VSGAADAAPPVARGRCVVFADGPADAAAICVTGLLLRAGVKVDGVVVRRRRWWRRWWRVAAVFLRRAAGFWTRRALDGRFPSGGFAAFEPDGRAATDAALRGFAREAGLPQRASVEEFAATGGGVAVLYCADFGDAAVLRWLGEARPRLILAAGDPAGESAGSESADVLAAAAGDGVLACHAGILPDYQGADALRWALLEGRADCVGVTVYFAGGGLCGGDVLVRRRVAPVPGEALSALRGRLEVARCAELAAAGLGWLAGSLLRQPQLDVSEKQYFTMHRRLASIVEKELLNETF